MNAATAAGDRQRSKSGALTRVTGGNGLGFGHQDVVAVAIQENKEKQEYVMEEDGVTEAALNSRIAPVIPIYQYILLFSTLT